MGLTDHAEQPLLAGPGTATRPLGRIAAGAARLLPALGIMAASRILGFLFVYVGGLFKPALVGSQSMPVSALTEALSSVLSLAPGGD